jgi:hypothetical protein
MGHLCGKSPAFAQKRPCLWNFLPVFAFRSGCLLRRTRFFPPPLPKIRQKAESENEKPELDIGKWEKKRISRKKYAEKFGGTEIYSDLCGVKSTPVVK